MTIGRGVTARNFCATVGECCAVANVAQLNAMKLEEEKMPEKSGQ